MEKHLQQSEVDVLPGRHPMPADRTSSSSDDGDGVLGAPHKELEGVRRSHSRSSTISAASDQSSSSSPDPDLVIQPSHDGSLGGGGGGGTMPSSARQSLSRARTGTSIGSTASRSPDFEVVFEPDDPANPQNWPIWYRAYTIFAVSFSTWVIVLNSTSYTATIPGFMAEFHVESRTLATLGITTYLFGLAVGSLVLAPASELYGRRPVYIICLIIYTALVIPTALAKSLTELLVVRFVGAVFGAAMISNSPGSIVDISNEKYRALCMSLWSLGPLNGPVSGPVIGGFVYQDLGWRWANWIVLILAGVAIILMSTIKETYAPTILQAKAAKLRKETDDNRWWSRYDEKQVSKWELIKTNISRPFILSFTEPILWFFNVWISLVYGILYLCFVAYPIIFVEYRGWGPGISGLAFVGIGIGTVLAIAGEPLVRRWIESHPKDPETGRPTPEASASAMTLGAVLTAVGQLVFSWTSLPVTIHWAVPIAFGIPFGAGNTLSFIYAGNYLASSYGMYAASALVGNAVMRSLIGGTLPLAGPSMYAALTPQWAGTLLGLLEVCLIPVPFIFYRYGAKIRAKSPIIRRMREEQERNEGRRAKHQQRQQRKLEKEEQEKAAGKGGVLEEDGTIRQRGKDETTVI